MTFIDTHKRLFAERMPRMKKVAAATLFVTTVIFGAASGIVFPDIICVFYTSVSASLLAALLFMYRSPYLYAAPILTALIAAVISGSIISALLSAAYTPIATATAIAFYRRASKARAIMISSVVLGATLAVTAILAYIIDKDSFPTAAAVTESVKDALLSVPVNTKDGVAALFTQDAASAIARYITLLIPAAFIITVNAVSYLSASMFVLYCRLFYFADRIPGKKWIYMPDTVPAVIFILSYFISAATVPYASADVIGYAAENVLIALTPAMLIAGGRVSFELSAKHDKKLLFIIVSAMTLIISPSLYLMVISFWGALYVIYKSLRPHLHRLFPGKDDDGK